MMPPVTNAAKADRFHVTFRLSLAVAMLCFIASPMRAQLYSGTLTGVVTDPSAALIPSANVTVTDTDKGTTFTAGN